MNYKDELSNILTNLQKEIKKVENELATLPSGRLAQETHNGKPALVVEVRGKDCRQRKTINAGNEEIPLLLRKKILSERLKTLRENEHIISRAVTMIREQSTYAQLSKLTTKYTLLNESRLLQAFEPPNTGANWEKQPFEQLDYKPEAKFHITSRGLHVRSKSELIIAETLYEYDIPFRYEMVLHFDSYKLAPDFTIMRHDGKIIYWEHQGLNDSKEYQDRQLRKLQIYISSGIVPWDNLILSYDNLQGSIDTRVIRSEIENKLIAL